MNLRGLCAVPLLLGFIGSAARADEKPKDLFYICPHTHWEGAVFKTREEYLQIGLPNILRAVQLLKKYPDYRFTLDQVAYVKPFIERFPEEAPAFRQFVKEGRIQLVLGMNIMPDVNMPGGESFLRQIQYGKTYYRKEFGVDVKLAWLVDTFGHHGQLPQILKLAGYDSFWFSRGVPKPDHPSEFAWEGIDGTRIDAYYLPFSYVLLYGAGPDANAYKGFVQQRFHMIDPNARGSHVRFGATGADVTEPEWHLPTTVETYNKWAERPIDLRFGTPGEYEAAYNKANPGERPVFKGEFNPVFQGVYSSRIELKQWMRSSQQRLTLAENLSSLATLLAGTPADSAKLWEAWEPVLFNETHDLASGVMTDHVYQDTTRGYDVSKRIAEDTIDERWTTIESKIDTRGDGVPVVVFNNLGWTRTDLAQVAIGFTETGVEDVALIGPDGKEIPTQITESVRYAPEGGIRRATVAFIARDVPAMGYTTYRAVGRKTPPPVSANKAKPDELENELYRLKFDPATGEIKSLLAKDGDSEVFPAGGANVVARQDDKGDLWELYKGLNGGQNIAMTNVQPVPAPPESKLSNQSKDADPAAVRNGAVFSEYDVWHPFDTGTFATRVRLYHGDVKRVDIRTQLVNQQRKVRYQALFPTGIKDGKSTHAIPLGAIQRPLGVEFPAQDWVDYSNAERGLSVFNVGLPGNAVTDGTMMLSLMRAHDLGAYGFGGGYEPGMSSESGMQLGKQFTLNYALLPHAGGWQTGGAYRAGMELNNPLTVRKALVHEGSLPKRWGLVEISHPNVTLSALKPSEDAAGIILRVYEAAGTASPQVRINLAAKLEKAAEVNLMEDARGNVTVDGDAIRFDLKPFEIKTFRLNVRAVRSTTTGRSL